MRRRSAPQSKSDCCTEQCHVCCNEASAIFVCKEHVCAVCGHSSTQPDAPSNLTCAAMTPVQSHCQILFRLSQSCRCLLPGAALQPRTPQRARATEHLPSHSCTHRPPMRHDRPSPRHHHSIIDHHRSITVALPHVIAASLQHHRPSP